MKKLQNIEDLKYMLSDNLTLFFINNNNKHQEMIDDISDLYPEVELLVLDVLNNQVDENLQKYFDTYFITTLPFLIVYEQKEVKRIMNGYNNINWLEYFMLGEAFE